MRHRGETVGHFFLAEKESAPAFTAEDEEVLVLFASQAATAIANATSSGRSRKKLRAKIGEDAASPTWIFNVRGVGYRMPRPDGS